MAFLNQNTANKWIITTLCFFCWSSNPVLAEDELSGLFDSLQDNEITSSIGSMFSSGETESTAKQAPQDLVSASYQGNQQETKRFLLEGADPNQANQKGQYALHAASHEGHLEVVKMLLIAGADANQKDQKGNTPLMEAAKNGQNEVAQWLISKGARPNEANESGYNPLLTAALNGHQTVVKTLLDNQAQGGEALVLLALNNKTEAVKVLIEQGVEVNSVSEKGWNAVDAAANGGHLELVISLLEQGAIPDKALLLATEKNHLEVVKVLLEKGVEGTEALVYFATHGNLEAIKILVGQGVKVNNHNENGWSAIEASASNGHQEIVAYLLKQGADGTEGINAAAEKGRVEIVSFLIQNGVDGSAALVILARNGNLKGVQSLVEMGVDVNATDKQGWSVLETAAKEGQQEVVAYLLSKGANGSEALVSLATNNSQVGVKTLVNAGVDLNSPNQKGWKAIETAANKGHLEVVEFLLENGADGANAIKYAARAKRYPLLPVFMKHGFTGVEALVTFASLGDLTGVQKLEQASVDLKAKNANGWSAIESAAKNGHQNVVAYLLEKGADGESAMKYAASEGHEDLVAYLLEQGAGSEEALKVAAKNGEVEVARELLQEGANGTEALVGFVLKNDLKAVQTLTQAKVDLNAKNAKGWSPLEAAASKGFSEIVAYLLQNGANGTEAIVALALNNFQAGVQALVEAGVQVDAKNAKGWSALETAATRGNTEVAQYLLNQGADGVEALVSLAFNNNLKGVQTLVGLGVDFNQKNQQGWNALESAATKASAELVAFLIQSGADGTATLVIMARNNNLKAVSALVESGMDVNQANAEGYTALSQVLAKLKDEERQEYQALHDYLVSQGAVETAE